MSLPSKAAAIRLQLEAETYGIEFNEHYLRSNGDGSVTVSVFGTEEQLDGARGRRLRGRRHDRGPEHLAQAGRGRGRPRSARRRARPIGGDRQARRSPRCRTRTPRSSSCARTTSRTTRAASCPSRPRRATATVDPATGAYTGPDAVARLERGRRHRDRLHAAADERQHRPGHDARHLHRASRARPHRRREQRGRRRHADAHPHRLEHGRVDGGRRQAVAGRRPAADDARPPVGLHDARTWTRPRSTRGSTPSRRSSRTSPR